MIISMTKAKKLVGQGNYVLITKDQMKEAVLTENLKRHHWVSGYTKDCPVCAVGAVLRAAGLSNSDVISAAHNAHLQCGTSVGAGAEASDIKKLLDQGHYLMALSARFETWAYQRKVIDEKLRRDLVTWISKSMPENLLVRTAL